MDISYVIPVYKDTELVLNCLNSFKNNPTSGEKIIVDDGSPKEYQTRLKEISKSHNCKLLTSFHNNGFSYAVNRGIESSDAEVVVITNNDIILDQYIETEIQRQFERDPKLGILGFQLLYPDGTVQHAGLRLMEDKTSFTHYDHGSKIEDSKMANISRYAIAVTGALFAIRKSMVDEIGPFNAGYKLAFEDTEFCLRAWHCGWHVFYTSVVSATHAEGVTRGRTLEEKIQRGFFDGEKISYKKYLQDIKNYDLIAIESRVGVLNERLL